jgi:hypothetical protein
VDQLGVGLMEDGSKKPIKSSKFRKSAPLLGIPTCKADILDDDQFATKKVCSSISTS